MGIRDVLAMLQHWEASATGSGAAELGRKRDGTSGRTGASAPPRCLRHPWTRPVQTGVKPQCVHPVKAGVHEPPPRCRPVEPPVLAA